MKEKVREVRVKRKEGVANVDSGNRHLTHLSCTHPVPSSIFNFPLKRGSGSSPGKFLNFYSAVREFHSIFG